MKQNLSELIYAKHLRGDELDCHRISFHTQMTKAKRRGIGWELTFEQWLEWWGDDLSQRGVGPGKLSMQRIRDTGPYALGNIEKGTQKQNSHTYSVMKPIKTAQAAYTAHQADLDAEMRSTIVRQGSRLDEVETEDQTLLREDLGFHSLRVLRKRFVASAPITGQM
jgi:hypothetical protein